jgi:hypothetical protein
VLAAVGAVAGVGVLVTQPRGGPPIERRSTAGGFTLVLDGGWVLREPDAAKPFLWAQADRPTRAGPSNAWLWVVRLPPVGDEPLTYGRDGALADIRRRWGDVDVETGRVTFAGHRSISLRYSHPVIRHLGFLPGGDAQEVRIVTVHAGQLYEIGMGGWPRLPPEASALDRHVRLTEPTGTWTMAEPREHFRITVPGHWNQTEPGADMPKAVWVAIAAPDPPAAWAILWKLDIPVDEAVADSVANATRMGRVTARAAAVVAGRAATRIDFEHPTDLAERTYYATWIFEGPDGRAWQLLVGAVRPLDAATTAIAASLDFTD